MGADDEPAFDQWYRMEYPRLVRALTVVAGDVEVAQEAAADTFARAFERWHRVARMDSPGGWAYKVALNLLRRRARRMAVERIALRRAGPPVAIDFPEPQLEVWRAVRCLPARMREAVALRYVVGMKESEVGAAMGISEGAASAALSTARRRLQGLLVITEEREEPAR